MCFSVFDDDDLMQKRMLDKTIHKECNFYNSDFCMVFLGYGHIGKLNHHSD